MADPVQVVADHSECLALAPIAFRTKCKVLSQRQEWMTEMGKGKKGKKSDDSKPDECAGKSLLQLMWEELDTIMERLMTEGAANEDDRGMALGVAYCIALVTNPYHVDIEAVREEAMERWQEKYGDDEG